MKTRDRRQHAAHWTHLWAAAVGAAYSLLYLAAVLSTPVLFALAAAAAFGAELALPRVAPQLAVRLDRAGFGATTRGLLRDSAVPLLLLREGTASATAIVTISVALLAVTALRGVGCAALRALATLRRLPLPTRNLDLTALRLPDPPSRWIPPANQPELRLLSAPAVAGVLIDVATHGRTATVAGLAVSLGLALALCAAAGVALLRNRRLANTGRLRAEVLRQVRAYRPEVLLYFSIGPAAGTTYQVDTWLETLAGLGRRTMILVRERAHVARIGPTALPIVCVPNAVDVMDLDLPDLKVVLYPGNVGKNIHMLRRNGVRHVFIAHGDSDKSASTNPFTRAYDEVWVAGPAGRDRYREAGSAVRDESIVEVGRPQVGAVRAAGRPHDVFTVLYAPTWEGWADDLAVSSLATLGPAIVATLLSLDPPVRVIYKPHPLTGYLDPATREAHRQVMGLIKRATDIRRDDPAWAAMIAAEEGTRKAAAAHLAALGPVVAGGLTAAPTAHGAGSATKGAGSATKGAGSSGKGKATGRGKGGESAAGQGSGRRGGRHVASGPPRPGGRRIGDPWLDGAAHALANPGGDPERLAALQAAERQWDGAFWASGGTWSHRVVQGPRPDLYSCFNQADLMIADVSAVVSDFLAADKPYVVCNLDGLGEAAFRARHTAARGAYVLAPDGLAALPSLVESARMPGADGLAEARAATRAYLLGPDQPEAMTRWRAALDALIARPWGATRVNGSRRDWASLDKDQGDAKVTFTFS